MGNSINMINFNKMEEIYNPKNLLTETNTISIYFFSVSVN